MPTNAFVSFDHDDQQQVASFRALLANPQHPLEFHDHSLAVPVVGKRGKPLMYPPLDRRSRPVRREIIRKFKNSSKMVVLVGEVTYQSDWVKWEIETFYEGKRALPGKTKKRIRAMRLAGCEGAQLPSALVGRSAEPMNWDPSALDTWLGENPGS